MKTPASGAPGAEIRTDPIVTAFSKRHRPVLRRSGLVWFFDEGVEAVNSLSQLLVIVREGSLGIALRYVFRAIRFTTQLFRMAAKSLGRSHIVIRIAFVHAGYIDLWAPIRWSKGSESVSLHPRRAWPRRAGIDRYGVLEIVPAAFERMVSVFAIVSIDSAKRS